jgi:trk system potassium uptake protein TrkA
MSEQHGKILNALGVDLVLYPDEFVGNKLASLLAKPGINELIELTDEFKIFEMKTPEVWQNKAIQDINLRKKYKLSIIFIKRGNKVLSPEPESELLDGDTLVVAGEHSKINAVANLISDASDIEAQLNSVFGEK